MTKDSGEVVQLVEKLVTLCFGGRVPDRVHNASIVHAFLAVCFPPNLEECTQKDLALELAQALDLLRRQQTLHWQN